MLKNCKVIINADDLGKSDVVNKAIAQALSDGVVSSSTILANTTTWEAVHAIVAKNPKTSFGVHLNLTEGLAMTQSEVLCRYGIVDTDNCFTKRVRELSYYPDELLNAIRREWDAQIHKVKVEENIEVTHLDGHHHIHTFYPFRNILVELAAKNGITKVRNRYCCPRPFLKKLCLSAFRIFANSDIVFSAFSKSKNNNKIFRIGYTEMENYRWRKFVGNSLKMTDYFDSYEHFCQVAIAKPFSNNISVELMCHPGHLAYTDEMSLIYANPISIVEIKSYKFI